MQDRYAGDIGDYFKLALLRVLQPGHRLGIAWWRRENDVGNGNGRHVAYLSAPEKWRAIDPTLFDGLARIVASGDRRIAAFEEAAFLPGAVYHGETVPDAGRSKQRQVARRAWLDGVKRAVAGCDMVFLDPDNGIAGTKHHPGTRDAGKSVRFDDLRELSAPGRTLVIYHHQTRFEGGHEAERRDLAMRFRGEGFGSVDMLRTSPFSPRVYILVGASEDAKAKVERFATEWPRVVSWHPASSDGPIATTDVKIGACHCGTVRFEARLANGLASAKRCDCSFCRMRGAVVVGATAVRVLEYR